MNEEGLENDDLGFLVEQFVLRPGTGRKRLHELFEQEDPEFYAMVVKRPPITMLMETPVVLAVVLGTSAHYTGNVTLAFAALSLTCKGFWQCAKRPEFWGPAIQAFKRKHATNSRAFGRISPFYRFPAHVPAVPDWPWYEFLSFLRSDGQIYYHAAPYHVSLKAYKNNHTLQWALFDQMKTAGWLIRYRSSTDPGVGLKITCEEEDRFPSTLQYYVRRDQYDLWADGIWLDETNGSTFRWVGAVENVTEGGRQYSQPFLGFGVETKL